jgi:hypothetical protein
MNLRHTAAAILAIAAYCVLMSSTTAFGAESCEQYSQDHAKSNGSSYPWGYDICKVDGAYCENYHDTGVCSPCYVEICFVSNAPIIARTQHCMHKNDATGNMSCGSYAIAFDAIHSPDATQADAEICFVSPCLIGPCPTAGFAARYNDIRDTFDNEAATNTNSYVFYCDCANDTCTKTRY